jgi:hypothetical protein
MKKNKLSDKQLIEARCVLMAVFSATSWVLILWHGRYLALPWVCLMMGMGIILPIAMYFYGNHYYKIRLYHNNNCTNETYASSFRAILIAFGGILSIAMAGAISMMIAMHVKQWHVIWVMVDTWLSVVTAQHLAQIVLCLVDKKDAHCYA